MPEYPFLRAAPINPQKLEVEIETAVSVTDGFRIQLEGEILVIAPVALTQPQIDVLATVIANHDPALTDDQQGELSGKTRLAQVIASNQDKLKYADYFLGRLAALLGLWQATTPNLTTRFNSTVTIMQGNRTSDADHMAMWRSFLTELETDFNIVRSGDDLPVLTAAQQRQVMIGAKMFITMGAFTAMILLKG